MSRELEMAGIAVYGTVCAVVWEDGGCEPSSYPILHAIYGMPYVHLQLSVHVGFLLRLSKKVSTLMVSPD